MPDVHGEPHDAGELVERYHVRSVGRGAGRIGMGLEKEAVGARGASHWRFLLFTGRPALPAATNRSVWRQRNAGIWRTSATRAAGATWAGSWTSVRIGRPVALRTFSSARSPVSRPGPRGAFRRERLALSYDAL